MESTQQRKQEADYSEQVNEAIPIAESLASEGKVQDAIDKLLVLEKQARNAADLSSLSRLLCKIPQILYKSTSYALLNSYILILSRKHGQMRQAVQKMVEECLGYVQDGSGLKGEERIKLIETLREVTEGKIFLEVPRARLTLLLSRLYSSPPHSNLPLANRILQEISVETFGSMERKEKVEFILEQVGMLMRVGEWDKMGIVAKKVNGRWLEERGMESLKLRHYSLLIIHSLHYSNYLQVTKHYRSILNTPLLFPSSSSSSSDPNSKSSTKPELGLSISTLRKVLRMIIYFICLSEWNNEQRDLLERIRRDDRLDGSGNGAEGEKGGVGDVCFTLIKNFTTPELMRWPGIEEIYGPTLRQTPVFKQPSSSEKSTTTMGGIEGISTKLPSIVEKVKRPVLKKKDDEKKKDDNKKGKKDSKGGVGNMEVDQDNEEDEEYEEVEIEIPLVALGEIEEPKGEEKGEERWKDLQKRVLEHNLRTISLYYSHLTLTRLSQLLDLPPTESESFLSNLVVSKMIYAKIDRPAGVVSFIENKGTDGVLNQWKGDLEGLMGLVEKSCHLIGKEHAVHAALKGQQQATKA